MWIKTIVTQFRKRRITVAAFVESTDVEIKEARELFVVKIKSMWEAWYLEQTIRFDTLEDAVSFVNNFTKEMAVAFLERTTKNEGIFAK